MAHNLEIHFPEPTAQDCSSIYAFLTQMYLEVGRQRGNPDKAMRSVYQTVKDEFVFNVLRAGEIIASAGLVKVEESFYSDLPFFTERWFYTHPSVRDDPQVARLMFGEIESLVNATGVMALITVFNPKRFVKGHRSTWGQVGEKFAIRPAGAVIAIQPGALHVRNG